MNLIIHKYLVNNNQFRLFTVAQQQFNSTKEDYKIMSVSALSTLLLNEEERITFNFKNDTGSRFLNIDAFSNHYAIYRFDHHNITDDKVMLFVNKSKLKNFGATYSSIMKFNDSNLIDNLNTYYRESEQLELTIIFQDNHILLLQPLPEFDKNHYMELQEQLSENRLNVEDISGTLIDEINVSIENDYNEK